MTHYEVSPREREDDDRRDRHDDDIDPWGQPEDDNPEEEAA